MQTVSQHIHLLLPETDLTILKRRAKDKGSSVASLIRHAIRQVYGTVTPDRRKKAFARLSKHSELMMEDWDTVKRGLLERYG